MPGEEPKHPIQSKTDVYTATTHQSGASTPEWIDTHHEDLSLLPPDDEIATTWYDVDDDKHTKSTTRNPGESDPDFRDRHMARVVEEMIAAPPVA